jgi:hypothetical protein
MVDCGIETAMRVKKNGRRWNLETTGQAFKSQALQAAGIVLSSHYATLGLFSGVVFGAIQIRSLLPLGSSSLAATRLAFELRHSRAQASRAQGSISRAQSFKAGSRAQQVLQRKRKHLKSAGISK